MGVDKGFDLFPPLSESEGDKAKWAAFLEEVKEKYKDDKTMIINKKGGIEFTVGEHPILAKDSHRFRRFSSKVSGSHAGNVEKYLNEVTVIARRHFGHSVCRWSEYGFEDENEPVYGWDEVYAAAKE